MSINTQIKQLREAKGLTQTDLAEQTQLSVRTIQRLESGPSEPKGHTLRRLRAVFGEDFGLEKKLPEELRWINMLCLTFLLIPFGNIIFPSIAWYRKRKMEKVNQLGRRIINFQISWYLISAAFAMLFILIQPYFQFNLIFWGMISLTAVNVGFILQAASRISQNRDDFYKWGLKVL